MLITPIDNVKPIVNPTKIIPVQKINQPKFIFDERKQKKKQKKIKTYKKNAKIDDVSKGEFFDMIV